MCTEFGIKPTNTAEIQELWAMSGRNMDWLGNTQAAKIIPCCAGTNLESEAPDGTAGLQWTSLIDATPISAFQEKDIVDGMNVEGLTFSANMLDCTEYPETPSVDNYAQSLGITRLGLWALSQFASVDDVIQAFRTHIDTYVEYSTVDGRAAFTSFSQTEENKIYLYQDDVLKTCWKTPGLHMSFRDKEGKAFIVEFLEGRVVGYTYEQNYVWTMTNDPTLPEQIKNLAKLNHLDIRPAPPITIYGQTISLPGAVNLAGLPGDPSPESRFARAAKKIQFLIGALQPKNANEALTACLNIADSAKVSKEDAFVCQVKNKMVYDETIYQIFRDSINALLYYRTNADAALKVVNLKELFSAGRKLCPIFLHDSKKQTVIDVTHKMESSEHIDNIA